MKISFLLVLSHKPSTIKDCLNSLQNSILDAKTSHPKVLVSEVVLVLNPPTPEVLDLIKEFKFPKKIVQLDGRTPAAARNRGLKEAEGDYICFLDDDVILPKSYLKLALEIIKDRPHLDIFGGPDQVLPNSALIEKIIGTTLCSPLATASTRFRHGLEKRNEHGENSLILCNLWIKKSFLFTHSIVFDDRLTRNEENILIAQMQEKGAKIQSIPYLYLYHRKSSNPLVFIRKVFSSGAHRAYSFRLYPQYFKLIYTTPTLFIFYLLGLPLFELIWGQWWIYIPLGTYIGLGLYFAIRTGLRKKAPELIAAIFVFQVLINFCYGLGFFFGYLSGLKRL